jgi:hypothetical protein
MSGKKSGEREPAPLTHITLAPDQPEGEVPTTRLGQPSSVFLLRGAIHTVLPDDSREQGVGETLARRLVEDGRCVPVGPRGGLKDAETPIAAIETAETPREPAADGATGPIVPADEDTRAILATDAAEEKPAAE